MMKRRSLFALGALLLAGMTGPALAEPVKVAIGYPPATDFLAAYVAAEKGIFAKHNIDPKMMRAKNNIF